MASVTLIYGPMFSGKSDRLIDLMKLYNEENILAFKSSIDIRNKNINSRNGKEHKAISIDNSKEILSFINENTHAVFIDELNFLNDDILTVINILILQSISVYLAGLDLDSKGDSFGPTLKVKEISNNIIQLYSKCFVCGNDAEYTARFINNKVDDEKTDKIILESEKGEIKYHPYCKNHHPILNRIN